MHVDLSHAGDQNRFSLSTNYCGSFAASMSGHNDVLLFEHRVTAYVKLKLLEGMKMNEENVIFVKVAV